MTSVTEPMNVIYGLSCTCHPGDGVRYVGLTRFGAAARLSGHLSVIRHNLANGKRMVHSQQWILKHGMGNIASTVLEACEADELNDAEIRWMAHYASLGAALTNIGEGGGAATKGQKRPAQAARMSGEGNPMWGQDRADIMARARSFQGPASDETRRRISEAGMGRKHSDESKAKMSASARVASHSPARLDLTRRRREGLVLSPSSKITAADVTAIRLERANSGASYASIGKPYGIGPENVSLICRRISWKHVA